MGEFTSLITAASNKFGVPASFLEAQMQAESGGDPNAVSHAGAVGLMQLMPVTAAEVGVVDRRSPAESIFGGAEYQAKKLAEFDGDAEKAIAAYNAGAGTVKKAVAAAGDDWLQAMPKETQDYVAKLLPAWQTAQVRTASLAPIEAAKPQVHQLAPIEAGPSSFQLKTIEETRTESGGRNAPTGERARGFGGGTFSRGVNRGVQQSQGLAGQLIKSIGDATGFVGAMELGDELIEEAFVEAVTNPARIHGLEDIDSLSKFATFMAQTLGEQVFNIALAASTGGAGAFLTRLGVAKSATGLIAKKAAARGGSRFLAKDVAERFFRTRSTGALKGAAAGTFTGFLPINTGEILQEQRDHFDAQKSGVRGVVEPPLGPSLLLGALLSGLEVLSFGLVGKAIFGAAKKEVVESAVRTVLRRTGHATLKSLAAEGGTEAVQEVLVIASKKINDPTFSIHDAIASSEGLSRIAFAGASGAVVGLAFGGAGGVASGVGDAVRIGMQRAEVRSKLDAGINGIEAMSFGKDQDGDTATSLFDLGIFRTQLANMVTAVGKSVSVAKEAAKNLAKGATSITVGAVNAAVVAARETQQRALKILDRESTALDVVEASMEGNRSKVDAAIIAARRAMANIATVENRGKKASEAVRKASDRVRDLIKSIEALPVEERAAKVQELLAEARDLINKGLADPTSVSIKHINRLLSRAQKFAKAGFDKTARSIKQSRKQLLFSRTRTEKALDSLPDTLPEQLELPLTQPQVQEEEQGIPEDQQVEDTTDAQLRTPATKIISSVDKVLKGVRKFAFIVGRTLDNLPASVAAHIAAGRLAAEFNGKEVVVTKKENEAELPSAKDQSFDTDVEDIDADDAVVVSSSDRDEVTPRDAESVQAVIDKVEAEGEEATVSGNAGGVVTGLVEELNKEADEETTVVRIYDEAGNLVASERVIDNKAEVDNAIQRLGKKHGLNIIVNGTELATNQPLGFAIVNNEKLHKTLLEGDSEASQLYKAIWKLRKQIASGRPMSPTTVVGKIRVRTGKVLSSLKNRLTGRVEGTITLQMLLDSRQDGDYIINQMMNLVQKNNDPDVWLERAIRHPELEEQTALFERQVGEIVSGNLGMDGALLFSNLTELPQQLWGVSVNSKGQPSGTLVEVQPTAEGWKTAQGKPMFRFTKATLDKLAKKLNQDRVFNRYGKKKFESDESPQWEVEVVEIEEGVYVIRQKFQGMDNNLVFNQIRAIVDRGEKVKQEDQYRIQATDPNGKPKKLHLGEITILGRMQRFGPGNLLLGTRLTQMHENFMYGLVTLINLGYEIPGVTVGKGPRANALAQAHESLRASNKLMNKVIFGQITFKESLASRKSLFALERFLDEKSELGGDRLTAALKAGLLDTPKGNLSLVALADFLIEQVIRDSAPTDISPTEKIKRIKRKRTKYVADLDTGKPEAVEVTETIYQMGDYTVEETGAAFVVRDKRGKIAAQLPKTLLEREEVRQISTPDKKSRRLRTVSNKDIQVLRDAFGKSEALSNVDRENLSILINLSGLYDNTLKNATEATVNEDEGTTNFLDPAQSNEAMFPEGDPRNEDLRRLRRRGETVLADEAVGQDEFQEVDFVERTRSVFDEDASREVPFTIEITQNETRREPDNVFATEGQPVRNLFRGWNIGGAVAQLLKKLNIKEHVILFDETGIDILRLEMQKIANKASAEIAKFDEGATDRSTQHERAYFVTQKNAALSYLAFLDKLKVDEPPGRINTGGASALPIEHRVMLIYVPKHANTNIHRGWRLAHEIGHLVQRTYLDALPDKIRNLVYESVSATSTEELRADLKARDREKGLKRSEEEYDAWVKRIQGENFANYMAAAFANESSGLVPKGSKLVTDTEFNNVEATMKEHLSAIVERLRVVYEWAKLQKDKFFSGTHGRLQSFHDFVSALNTYTDIQAGKIFKPPKGMTPLGLRMVEELEAANAGPYIRYDYKTDQAGAQLDQDMELTPDAEERAKDSVFQNYVDDFRAWAATLKDSPWLATKMLVYTADGELRSMGKFGTRLARAFHALPASGDPSNTIFRTIMMKAAPHFTALQAILSTVPGARISLWESMFNRNPSAKVRAERELRDQITEALLLQTPLKELSPEVKSEVKKIRGYLDRLYEWYTKDMGMPLEKRRDYYPMMLDTLVIEKNRGKFMEILMKHGFSETQATRERQKLTRDEDGGLTNGFQEDLNTQFDFLGPGFSSARPRADRNTQWSDELRADLVAEGFYQHDIATTLIAYTEMMTRRAVWTQRFQEKSHLSPTTQLKKEYERFGLNIHSPIAKLQLMISQARARGEINEWQFNRIVKDILPAYAGQLGLRTNSHVRRLSAGVVIYQNVRLLSLAVLSSFVDVGTLFLRGGWSDHRAPLQLILNKATREEAFEMLEAIGAMRQGLTEHVLNDQALNTFMTGNAKRINDLFFKYNGMEGWTNLMRAMGLVSAREFIQRNARKAREGDALAIRYLAELGITEQDEAGWDGHSTDRERINFALNRYIDEAMIRPDPSIRPVYMSDPGYSIFSHLKGFLYGFHETFLRRVGREAVIHQNLLPLLMLGMLALPFAAVGYELRRKITGSKSAPEGFDYFLEVVERSGMPGAFQLVVDMEQADAFGKPFAVGIGGPAVEQLYDFLTSDVATIIPRAIPVVAQSPVLRDWVRDRIE